MRDAIFKLLLFCSLTSILAAENYGYKITRFETDENGLISKVGIELIVPASNKSIPSQVFLNKVAIINAGTPGVNIKKDANSIVYNFDLDVTLHLDEDPFAVRGTPEWRLVNVQSTYTKIDNNQKFIPIISSSIHVLGIGFDWVADDKYIKEWFENHAQNQ